MGDCIGDICFLNYITHEVLTWFDDVSAVSEQLLGNGKQTKSAGKAKGDSL